MEYKKDLNRLIKDASNLNFQIAHIYNLLADLQKDLRQLSYDLQDLKKRKEGDPTIP